MDTRRGTPPTHWEGVLYRHPPAPSTLRVRGWPSMPTPLHIPMLRRSDHQGSDPRVLVLELTALAPVHPAPQIVTPVFVHYEERTGQEYDRVRIRSAAATERDASFDVEMPRPEVMRDHGTRLARAAGA